ncbi:general secretion pathway protein GspB [Aquabacterium sp.]|uniref:general secretion pathway protein GspB n=1 Tax=Aquabacterium sp. TaxID=1872578 RepID=UPI003CFFAAFA
MSYILDALKKADAEREQGQVPGLHTPTGHTDLSDGPQLRTPPLWVMGLGALLVLIALGAVWLWPRPVAVIATAPTQPQSLPAGPVAEPEPTPAPALTPAPESRPEASATANRAGNETSRPAPEATPTPPPSRPPRAEPAITRPVAPAAPRSPIHVDPAPAPTPSSKVPTLAELPDEVRRSLPSLSVSGAMYSDSPANRMLLINNRVFHEGDQPVAGLVLEEIRLKSAVFRYRGTRYAVSY